MPIRCSYGRVVDHDPASRQHPHTFAQGRFYIPFPLFDSLLHDRDMAGDVVVPTLRMAA